MASLLYRFPKVASYGSMIRSFSSGPKTKVKTAAKIKQSRANIIKITMGLKTGIVGLPNVGKSTMFNALTKSMNAEAGNFPFCTIDPNVGSVPLPDPRLRKLAELSKSIKVVPTIVQFVDIAGLVAGASEGKGKGNAFLSNIRETDAIIQVVRCFQDDNIVHVSGKIDPLDDVSVINYELAIADLQTVENRLPKAKRGPPAEQEALKKLQDALNSGKAARSVELNEKEAESVKNLNLLTSKPMIYAANVAEDDLADPFKVNLVQQLQQHAQDEGAQIIPISARIEEELTGLSDEEAKEFMQELGVQSSGLDLLIQAAYKQLGLLTYYTSGPQESRAWTIKDGMTAPQAAGCIHSDFEQGFIKAETVSYADLVQHGGEKEAKEANCVRIEGKEYVVKDGDVMLFKFKT